MRQSMSVGKRLAAVLSASAVMGVGMTMPAVGLTPSAAQGGGSGNLDGQVHHDNAVIVKHRVSFRVHNTNRSGVACNSDGKTYTVRGHITGPIAALDDPHAVTLFLHGLSYGEFFTTYSEQLGYNFAYKQARAGKVTVTIDRLGYDRSDKPVGFDSCFGSQADIAHQIVTALHSGHYGVGAIQPPAFPDVVLAGHSVGAIIAQTEAYSFGNIQGLILLSYSDTTVSAAAKKALAKATAVCAAGGHRSDGQSGPTGYVYFGATTPQQFIAAHFYTANANPAVFYGTAAMRNRDPCGDVTSYKDAVAADLAHIDTISVPVLVLTGGEDAIYPVPATEQASLLTGSDDVTAVTVPGTAHAITLHYSRNIVSQHIADWLSAHGE